MSAYCRWVDRLINNSHTDRENGLCFIQSWTSLEESVYH